MARRATIVDSLETAAVPYLHLDLGDFVSTQNLVAEQRSRVLWEEMATLGVGATTPGRRELSQWEFYESLLSSGEVPVVSSNLYRGLGEEEKVPLASRYLLEDIGGVRLGLFGLIGANDFANARIPDGAGISFQDPIEAAREIVPELRQRSEITVLLSQLSRDDTKTLIDSVPGIDIALLGNRPRAEKQSIVLGNTITNQAGPRGQWAGILDLIVAPDGRIVEQTARNRPLDGTVAKDPETLRRAEAAEAESARIRNEDLLAEKREQAAREGSTRYLGAETCKRCHASEYEHWRTTPHAKAFATLNTDHGMEKTAECTGCHVTGWEAAGGWVGPSTRPDLRNVQCEACHGPGTEHVRTGGKSRLTATACTGCHQGEFAKNWNFETYYELVRHE